MTKDLRILMVEDVAADTVLINSELRRNGVAFVTKRVETREKFLRELQENKPDIILSDHGLPDFDGFAALAIARSLCPEVPFIFVTGSMGEETIAGSLRSGAVGHVLKERLSIDLVPTIQRAVREAEERRKRAQMEQALEENEEQFRLLVQGVKEIVQAKEALKESQTRYQQLIDLFPDPVMVQRDGEIVFVNEAAIRLLGAENRVQLTGKPMKDIVNPDDWDRLYDHMRRLREEGTAFFIKRTDESQNWQSPFATIEAQLIRVDGAAVDVALMAAPMSFQEQPAVMVFANVLRKSMSA